MVSFELSQGPIRIYNSGIGIYPFSIVKPVWKNAYFNEKEAAAAHKIFEDYLRNNKYTGISIGKWVDDDYNMLLSVFNGLRNNTLSKPVRQASLALSYKVNGVEKITSFALSTV